MSSKKLIIVLIISFIVFGLFMRYAFISLQENDIDLKTHDYVNQSSNIEKAISFLDKNKYYEYIKGFSMSKHRYIFINHLTEDVVYWSKDETRSIKYEDIPNDLMAANSYYTKINGEKTIVINTDTILGNLEERIVVEGYKYSKLSQKNLDPAKINYFLAEDENIQLRYLRNKMINELIDAYKNKSGLENVKAFFMKWKEIYGEDYNNVAFYDLYEGYQEYIKIKYLEKNNEHFDLFNYLEEKKSKFGFFSKEDEYRIFGMLMIRYSYENNIDLDRKVQSFKNIYNNFMYHTPIIDEEINVDEFNKFKSQYSSYLDKLLSKKEEIFEKEMSDSDAKYSYKDINAESYDLTVNLGNNYYLYTEYESRLKNGEKVSKDYIVVKVTPYKINYYLVE